MVLLLTAIACVGAVGVFKGTNTPLYLILFTLKKLIVFKL
jgi:hypothetical protein